jgi:predicted N-acetyltransferase YhbS
MMNRLMSKEARAMEWKVRELAAEETHSLRRAVSADGRTDLQSMHHELDDTPGAWHLGAVDATDRVVAIASFYLVPYPTRRGAWAAFELAFMAVDPAVQGKGAGSAVMSEAIRRLKATDAILLWASARDTALHFYERFGFTVAPDSQLTPAETGRPHHLIALDIK